MTSHDPAYAGGYLLGQFLIQIALLVAAVALLLTGVIVAIRAKQTAVRGCAIIAAIAGLSLLGLAASAFIFGIIGHLRPELFNASDEYRVVSAKDNSCEISVPVSWLENPKLKEEAVIVANDSTQNGFVMVLRDLKQDYTGSLVDYASDAIDRMRKKLKSSEVGPQQTATIQTRSAIQQVVRGEINRLRIAYFVTYVEGETGFYQIICWSLESKEASARTVFEKITHSFRERVQAS
jgi:hypothetical protein